MSGAPFVIVMNDDGTYYLQVEPTPEAMAELAAKAVVFWGRKAIERRSAFHLALSGGSTPKALYRRLSGPPYADQLDWQRVHLWWSDERAVPHDHPDSNYNLAYDALIAHVPIPPENVHRVQTELGLAGAAEQYEAEIRSRIAGVADPSWPTFDLILLGMGDDGHTASLFPHTPALAERSRLVASQVVPQANVPARITFTPPLINAADVVCFMVSGASKAGTLRRVLLGEYQPQALPAQLIAPTRGKLFWMVDAAAASHVAAGPAYPSEEFIYRRMR
ncbi:MAG: 6-phosphogluconolactonase [Chloroflexi bacterium]|jgi:6-phosphogluconolactonase|uniref:6-phosphogluconolactonase n=2 Tax=Candidatus Thermofonsia Clade 3 TaxID=2364209 RepID=A0A2M8QGM1_9CHLR|nr:MAG: 6-phosphogluconolactonase [Candidatus Thermofonsia Clade 3 bacterium]RMG65128.1 MAG: 6-phosphogluconolactonase [Chloroflexota bacterium]